MSRERRARSEFGASMLSRRALMRLGCGAALSSALVPVMSRAQDASPRPRVAVFDWGLAETLLALGVAPVVLSETAGYRQWVIEPALPEGVAEAGLRIEPNFELIAAMQPELILITPELEPLRAMLQRIAKTETLAIYQPGGDVWERARETATAMAKLLGRAPQGEALLDRVDKSMEAAREKLGTAPHRPIYLVNFIDRRHVRIYGKGSIFQAVLDRLGLANAYDGGTSFWGFATLGIEHLAGNPDAQLIYLEPLPEETRATFENGPLWAALPFVRQGRVRSLPPVWSFGGIASAERLARLLSDELASDARSAGKTRGAPS